MSIDGVHRTLLESLNNPFRPGRIEDETLTSFRTSLVVKVQSGQWNWTTEIQDSRAYDIEDTCNLNPGSVNALEPIQFFAEYRWSEPSLKIKQAGIKAGRFTLSLGSRRMIGRNVYRNTLFNFVGVHSHVTTQEDVRLDGFWMMPNQTRPNSAQGFDDNQIRLDRFSTDLWVSGVFAELPWQNALTTRHYALALRERDSEDRPLSADRRLTTIGTQVLVPARPGNWDLDMEGALQRAPQTRNKPTTRHYGLRCFFWLLPR